MLVLDCDPISLDAFLQACTAPDKLEIADQTNQKILTARQTVEELVFGDKPVYGLNTGLGGNLDYRLKPEEIPQFQMQMLRGRAVACGDPLPEISSRGALLARILSAASGYSGISMEMFQHLCRVYEMGFAPVIPEYGSIGAGDLVQNAHMALALMGEGELWQNGARMDARTALDAAGIFAPEIRPKDAMVLINHSGLTVARSAIALGEVVTALRMLKCAAVLSFEGYGANREVLAEEVNSLRPSPSQYVCAEWFRKMLDGAENNPRRIQEALSFRTVASVIGVTESALNNAIDIWQGEANGSSDSPVILEGSRMASTANFHSPGLALALEQVSLAMVGVANGSVQRMQKLMNPDLSGLPKYLSPVGEGSAGMVPSQKTAVSLLAEIRHCALPVMFDVQPVSDTVEDMAPMTSQTAEKLNRQTGPLKLLAGLEALVACQALDLRKPEVCGKITREIWPAIRQVIPMLESDRALGSEITLAAECLERQTETNIQGK
ncbi:MAG: aromatic amino acid ammonia-lyase [Pseudomonadota bacterium]